MKLAKMNQIEFCEISTYEVSKVDDSDLDVRVRRTCMLVDRLQAFPDQFADLNFDWNCVVIGSVSFTSRLLLDWDATLFNDFARSINNQSS